MSTTMMLSMSPCDEKQSPPNKEIAALASTFFPLIQEQIKDPANLEHFKGIKGVFQLHLNADGKRQGSWYAVIKGDQEPAEVHEGVAPGKPTLTTTLDDSVLLQIATGKLTPMKAFMSGKVKLAGNIMLAQKLEGTFKGMGGYDQARTFALELAKDNAYLKSKL